jgi:hypothetical protein
VSPENVEIVRRANVAFRSGDWDTVAAQMDPHVLIRTDPRWPEQYIYRREATLAWYRELGESGGTDLRIKEVRDLGDRVLGRMRRHIHGMPST